MERPRPRNQRGPHGHRAPVVARSAQRRSRHMGETIDRLAKALAAGASRRETIGALVAGLAAALPWSSAARESPSAGQGNFAGVGGHRRHRRPHHHHGHDRHGHHKHHHHRGPKPDYAAYLEYCESWCGGWADTEQDYENCVEQAQSGKGPCYETGPGHYCVRLAHCGKGKSCCPATPWNGVEVTTGVCCTSEEMCDSLNSTHPICVPV